MTRANLNFIYQNSGEAPRTLFHYHNGDQYPEGLLCFYGLESFLTVDRPWTPEDFRGWIQANYTVPGRAVTKLANGLSVDRQITTDQPAEPEDLGEGGQPRIYFTDGFITDYSYEFEVRSGQNHVTVWNWDQRVFRGTARRFLSYCRRRMDKRSTVALPHHSEQALLGQVLALVQQANDDGAAAAIAA